MPPTVPVLGPWSGRLANDSDSVELVKPDAVQLPPHSDAGFVPQVLVDKVRYSALAPWPTATANGSNSLQRLSLTAYANDSTNWFAAPPSAGRTNFLSSFVDTAGDGMDDTWEMTCFHTLARNGAGDFDGDRMTDLQEYLAGTDPTNPASALRILSLTPGASDVLSFTVVAGHTYTVQYRDSLAPGSWTKLADLPAQWATGAMTVTDTNTSAAGVRFYRVATPAQP